MSIDVYSRWLHVWFAAALLGGTVFSWWALAPAVKDLTDEQKPLFREWVNARWRIVVFVGIAVLLLTGLYNWIVVGIPAHKGDKIYHMLMGIKFLLALVAMFFASVMAGRSPKFEGMRRRGAMWNLILIGLVTVIYAIGGFIKVAHPSVAPLAAAPPLATPPATTP